MTKIIRKFTLKLKLKFVTPDPEYKHHCPVDRVFGCRELRASVLDFNFFKVGSFDELTDLSEFYGSHNGNFEGRIRKSKEFFKNHVFYKELVKFMNLQKCADKLNAFKHYRPFDPLSSFGRPRGPSKAFMRILIQQLGKDGLVHRSCQARITKIAFMSSNPKHNEKRKKEIERLHKMMFKAFKYMYTKEPAFCPFINDVGL